MTKVIPILLALLVSACATKDPLLKQVEEAKEERADKVAEISRGYNQQSMLEVEANVWENCWHRGSATHLK